MPAPTPTPVSATAATASTTATITTSGDKNPNPNAAAGTVTAVAKQKDDKGPISASHHLKIQGRVCSNTIEWDGLFVNAVQKADRSIWLQIHGNDPKNIPEIMITKAGPAAVELRKMPDNQLYYYCRGAVEFLHGIIKIVSTARADQSCVVELLPIAQWNFPKVAVGIKNLQLFRDKQMWLQFDRCSQIVMLTPAELQAGFQNYFNFLLWLDALSEEKQNEFYGLQTLGEVEKFIKVNQLPEKLAEGACRLFNNNNTLSAVLCFLPNYDQLLKIATDLDSTDFIVVDDHRIVVISPNETGRETRFYEFDHEGELQKLGETEMVDRGVMCSLQSKQQFAVVSCVNEEGVVVTVWDFATQRLTAQPHNLGMKGYRVFDVQLLPNSQDRTLVILASSFRNQTGTVVFVNATTGSVVWQNDFTYVGPTDYMRLAINSHGEVAFPCTVDDSQSAETSMDEKGNHSLTAAATTRIPTATTKPITIKIVEIYTQEYRDEVRRVLSLPATTRSSSSLLLLKDLITVVDGYIGTRDQQSAVVLRGGLTRPIYASTISQQGAAATAALTIDGWPAAAVAGGGAAADRDGNEDDDCDFDVFAL